MLYLRFCRLVGIVLLLFLTANSLTAQSGLDAITFTWVDVDNSANDYTATSASNSGQTIDDNVSYDIFFSRNTTTNNNRRVSGYTIGGTSYSFLLDPDTLALRRVGSATRLSLWMEAELAVDNTNDDIFIAPERQVPERSLYQANLLNIGYDNVLVNSGTNASNIERIDAIYRSGMLTSTPANAIIPVMDRGHNGEFKIAMITSLDANGDPASYGNLISVAQSDFGGGVVTFSLSILFLQQALGENPIPTGSSTQNLGGVGISFAELGIAANEIVYGYSLFSVDVNTTDHDLTDISTFPTDSNNSGLDMAAGAVSAVSSDGLLVEATGPGGYKSSLSTWLKANESADVTTSTDGSTVTDWQDHWLGDHDATTGVAAPTYRSTSSAINFNPTVDFTTSSTSLTITNNSDFNTASSYTNKGLNIAFRTNTTDVSTRQVLYEQGGETRGINIYVRNGNLHVGSWNRNNDGSGAPWNNSGNITTVSTAVSADTEYIVTLELAGNSSITGTVTGYLNGASFGTISSVGLLFNDTDGIEFGGSDGSTQYDDGTNSGTNSFEGEISEFIYCNEPGSFTSAIRNRMESYLAIKYGITLDQTSPINYTSADGDIIFNTTNNASIGGYLEYNNDIAGIGRDDDSELDQPASKSENTDAIVTIDRGATISTDDTWLIWGNDNGALTETSALTMPDTIDSRLTRVWRVAEENEVLTTSVSFDITGLGLSTNQSQFSLLVAGNSTNADFSNATVISGGTLVGNTLTFTAVDLEDGQYFTLGTDFMICSPGGVETNLYVWLRADQGTSTATDNTTLSTWSDQSINGVNATADGNPPLFKNNTTDNINFNPVIDFDGTDDRLTLGNLANIKSGATNGGDYAIFTVSDRQDGSVENFIIGSTGGVSNQDLHLGYRGNNTQVTLGHWSNDINLTTTAFDNPQVPFILYGAYDGSGRVIEESRGGNFGRATDSNTTDIGGSQTNYIAFLNSNYYNGTVPEVIIFDNNITDLEKQRVYTYIAVKYGIEITNDGDNDAITGETISGSVTEGDYVASDGTTIIWDHSGNTSFHNDVAGIGRDDLSCLDQKQSISQNTDAIVTIGLGTIATDNGSNTNTFSTDKSFLAWGNDNASTTFAGRTTGVTGNGTVTERMTRIWRADENNGDVGSTSISFDLTGLGYGTTLSDYQLIVSDNSDLSSSTQYQAATINGNTVTFTGINLTDGQYFTLGTARTACGPGGVTSDLYVWLRADAGTSTTTDNTTLSTWSDQSGTGTDAASDGNPPLFKNNTTDNINFNPTLDFDGANDRLDLGSLTNIKSGATNGGDYTLVTVGLRQTSGNTQYILGSPGGTGNQDLHFGYRTNTAATIAHWGNDLDVTVSAFDSPQTAPFLLTAEYDGTTRIVEETRSGAFARSSESESVDLQGTKTNYIGDVQSLANYNGLISEIIVFDNDITDLQKQQVYTYLAIKYGITLTDDADNDAATGETISGSVTEGDYVASDGSTIVWDYSANTTYHNDVAGIGRDDDGCFSQKQSTAADTDDILTVGLGSVATSNGDNLNSFDDDKDFLIWGNDNGATAQASANTADVPTTIAERMTRVWKVQDNGMVGNTELQFDLTGLGYTVTDATDFSLLVGNTATMADAAIVTGGTLNGNVISFSGIDLTDGQFFTLATQKTTCGPGGVNTNIAIWFRADLEVFSDAGSTAAVDGANVQQWNDQSSPARNASEDNNGGGSPVEPTFETNEVNFNPVIRFSDAQSNNNSWLETASNATSGAMTLISVFKTAQNNGSATDFTESPSLISAEAGGTNDYALGLGEGRLFINAADNNTYNARSTPTYVDEVVRIGTATRTQSTAAGSIQLYVNSENVASGVSTNTTLNSASTFAIGNHSVYDADGQFEGDIAETLVFDAVLSATERARVESYLALKYGITRVVTGLSESEEDYFAADGGIIWDIDNQGSTYHNDIFGIGRDDLSCFEQTQSKSENSDALVTISNGGSFSTDDSFLISGNDNAAIEEVGNKERPAEINSRLNREWRVQETGTVGSVSLTYDLSTISGPLGVGTNNLNLLRLMVDDDGDFSSGATLISPTSINGNTATFSVDFTTGQYYTLGSTEENALPVTLVSFTATNDLNQRVVLEWTTAWELGNAFYNIERSTDTQSFETIGQIDGAGNANELIDYRFIDNSPLTGQVFYRLKQTDFNGEFEYSQVLRVYIEKESEKVWYKLYPNPQKRGKVLQIERLDSMLEAPGFSYQILSLQGKIMMAGRYGESQPRMSINTKELPRGIYLLRIVSDNQTNQVIRFVIQ